MHSPDIGGDERKLLDLVPSTGETIGNIKLRRDQLNWGEERYRRARDKLVEKGLLGVGVGRGGSVFRVVDVAHQETAPIGRKNGDGQRIREEELYAPLMATIEQNWTALFQGYPKSEDFWIDSSPRLGSKATGGASGLGPISVPS